MSDLETLGWVAPEEITNATQLIGNMRLLKAAFDGFAGGSIDLTSFVPTFSLSDDGRHFVVTSGSTDVSIPFPDGFAFRDAYLAGTNYVQHDVFTYLGVAWIVGTDFTATAPDTDTANFCRVFCQGGVRRRGAWSAAVPYAQGDVVTHPAGSRYTWWLVADAAQGTAPPDWTAAEPATSTAWVSISTGGDALPATQVRDVVQGETQDVLNAHLLDALATLMTGATAMAARVAANTANVKAINDALAAAGVAGFPVVLQEPAATGTGGSTGGGTGSGGTGGSGTVTPDPGTTPTTQGQRNVMASIGNYVYALNANDLPQAQAYGFPVSGNNPFAQAATLADAQALVDTLRSYVTTINNTLGGDAAPPNRFGAAADGTFPIQIPAWSDCSTLAELTDAITQLRNVVLSLDDAMAQANTVAIGNLAAATYPKGSTIVSS